MSGWTPRPFGATGLSVSPLGFGAGQIGSPALDEQAVARLLNEVLDCGITLIDTARGYGLSEERIGRHLAGRRAEFVLSTKVGYDIPGHQDWTGPGVAAGIDAALGRLGTDYLDIVHLHSCPLETLERGEVIAALDDALRAGKIRVAAYSGDNAPLDWAVRSGRFGSVETSVNLCDQRFLLDNQDEARRRALGVIAKRPVANAPWRFAERPVGDYAETYWERWQAMGVDPHGFDWQELALRFACYLPGVHSCIVGTGSVDHLRLNRELAGRGPLPEHLAQAVTEAFLSHGRDWPGQV